MCSLPDVPAPVNTPVIVATATNMLTILRFLDKFIFVVHFPEVVLQFILHTDISTVLHIK
jgi:hypothetical protein